MSICCFELRCVFLDVQTSNSIVATRVWPKSTKSLSKSPDFTRILLCSPTDVFEIDVSRACFVVFLQNSNCASWISTRTFSFFVLHLIVLVSGSCLKMLRGSGLVVWCIPVVFSIGYRPGAQVFNINTSYWTRRPYWQCWFCLCVFLECFWIVSGGFPYKFYSTDLLFLFYSLTTSIFLLQWLQTDDLYLLD